MHFHIHNLYCTVNVYLALLLGGFVFGKPVLVEEFGVILQHELRVPDEKEA